MSLSIKALQARARATYASHMPVSHLPDCYAQRATLRLDRKPAVHTPLVSPLTRDMFAVVYAGIPSAMALYDRIECAPSVGRNLSARA